MEIVTREDLQLFRIQLLDDIKKLFETAPKKEEQEEWVKSNKVRKMLDVSPGTLQNLRVSGKINPVKIEGSWYYSVTEIKSLFQKQ